MSEIDEQGWGIIRRTFGVDNKPDNLLAMREVLAQRLGQLAAEDPEQLLRLLYRIDVNERASDHALAAGDMQALAGAVILRVMEKAVSRRTFILTTTPSRGRGERCSAAWVTPPLQDQFDRELGLLFIPAPTGKSYL